MPKMTNAQLRQFDKLSDEKESAVNEIYGMAPNDSTRWSDCAKLASPKQVARYDAALSALVAFEHAMVSAGRAWRDKLGGFHPNT